MDQEIGSFHRNEVNVTDTAVQHKPQLPSQKLESNPGLVTDNTTYYQLAVTNIDLSFCHVHLVMIVSLG